MAWSLKSGLEGFGEALPHNFHCFNPVWHSCPALPDANGTWGQAVPGPMHHCSHYSVRCIAMPGPPGQGQTPLAAGVRRASLNAIRSVFKVKPAKR
jgi:hypothetical protein